MGRHSSPLLPVPERFQRGHRFGGTRHNPEIRSQIRSIALEHRQLLVNGVPRTRHDPSPISHCRKRRHHTCISMTTARWRRADGQRLADAGEDIVAFRHDQHAPLRKRTPYCPLDFQYVEVRLTEFVPLDPQLSFRTLPSFSLPPPFLETLSGDGLDVPRPGPCLRRIQRTALHQPVEPLTESAQLRNHGPQHPFGGHR